MFFQKTKNQQGSMMIYLIITIFIFSIVMVPILDIITRQIQALRLVINKEQSLQIAEAGINYYQWHLAHFPTDYQDGTGQPGPYVHDYKDYDTQEVIGTFSLEITPPPAGSTIATVKSTGQTAENPGAARTITVKYGIPSLAKYAFLSSWHIWIYPSDLITGQFMSNNGIRFEGIGNAPIQSAKETYICTWPDGCSPNQTKPGIWGNPMPPQSTQNFWQFPVPAVDFSALTSTLSDMKTLASQDGGAFYLPPSNKQGYSLVFNSNGTVSVYKVKKRRSNPTSYGYVYDVWTTRSESSDYGTGGSDRELLFTNSLPSNGIIFAEDNVWVEGTVRGRVTVAAAKLGETNLLNMPIIYVPNNIVYSAKDGSDILGLIAQRDIVYSFYSPTDLEVDAAQIAQNGATQVLYYGSGHSCPINQSCPSQYPYIKNSITTYGSIMSYDGWVWTWSNFAGTIFYGGYMHTYNNYDGNLLYSPPPSFPFSTAGYQQLNWISN